MADNDDDDCTPFRINDRHLAELQQEAKSVVDALVEPQPT
jgi:hypothetical protein